MSDDVRTKLLEAALTHVPFDGWSKATLDAAAADLDMSPATAHALYPGGTVELIEEFYRWGDQMMIEAFEAGDEVKGLGPKVERLVRLRIETCQAHKEAWRAAIGTLALPMNLPVAAKTKMRTVDLIWTTAGDQSADFSYYTKRATLVAILSTTTLFWLADDSEGNEETWGFLKRRIADIGTIGKFRRKVEESLKGGLPFSSKDGPRFSR